MAKKRIINTITEAVPPGDVLTDEEIKDCCCELVPVDECSEVGRISDYGGAEPPDYSPGYIQAQYPDIEIMSIQYEAVGPGSSCGKKRESWDDCLSCCDEVQDMVWDSESNPDVLPADSSIELFVDYGKSPYTWKTTNNDTWFTNGKKSIETDCGCVTLYAGADFCGATDVSVDDGCSNVGEIIRADQGQWVLIQSGTCKFFPVFSGQPRPDQSVYISGKYKQVENLSELHWDVQCGQEDNEIGCTAPEIYQDQVYYTCATYPDWYTFFPPGSTYRVCSNGIILNNSSAICNFGGYWINEKDGFAYTSHSYTGLKYVYVYEWVC